jgi:DHA1 family bicyclomycin/chloramphenicol resistance-like MFS transporter
MGLPTTSLLQSSTLTMKQRTDLPPLKPAFFPLSIILVLLLGTQAVATDLYLPALPQIAHDLRHPAGRVQWTLTAFVLAYGLGQLGAGALVDRYGRRRALLWGLGLYAGAALAGALATQLSVLVASRALLGVATAACVIAVRAIIRDSYAGAAGLSMMARSMTGMAVISFFSPVLGGLTAEYLGWHATMGTVAVFGIVAWIAVYTSFAETLARAPGVAAASFLVFLRTPQFVFSSLLAGLSFTGAIGFLLLSPFVFIGQFGMSRVEYGFMPALCSLAFLVGTVACRRCLRRWSVTRVVKVGATLSLTGGASQFLLWYCGVGGAWALMLPQCVFMLGHGFNQPCGQGGAVEPFPQHAGRAAALSGLIITGSAFIGGQFISASGAAPSSTLVTAMTAISLALGLLGWVALPRAYAGRAALAGQPT